MKLKMSRLHTEQILEAQRMAEREGDRFVASACCLALYGRAGYDWSREPLEGRYRSRLFLMSQQEARILVAQWLHDREGSESSRLTVQSERSADRPAENQRGFRLHASRKLATKITCDVFGGQEASDQYVQAGEIIDAVLGDLVQSVEEVLNLLPRSRGRGIGSTVLSNRKAGAALDEATNRLMIQINSLKGGAQ